MEILHPTFGGQMVLSSSRNDSLTLGVWNFTAKASGVWMMYGIVTRKNSTLGKKHKINLTSCQPMLVIGEVSLLWRLNNPLVNLTG
jgi:hypothetical protein